MNVKACANNRWKYYRPLLAAALLLSGSFQFVLPVLAAGTAAGRDISNTATATYKDPNNPNNPPIPATSNEVVIKVAEVAGITVTPTATTDVNGGSIQPTDVVNYDFTVTNVGNDPTQIFVPSTPTVTGGTPGPLQYSIDNGTTYLPVPPDGLTPSIPADGSVLVRVPVTISPTANPGDLVNVVLGDTGPNDNTPDTQNQPDLPDGSTPNEVRTVDNPGTTNGDASANPPTNGEREASASNQITVAEPAQVFNGPNDTPQAQGPTDNNDDFTNVSTPIPPGTPQTAPIDPDPTPITNTIQNGSATDTVPLTILPTPPDNLGDLPPGTKVTITTIPTDPATPPESATYIYDPVTGTYTYDPTAPTNAGTGPNDPVITEPIAPGGIVDYTVTVDLPPNTPQVEDFPITTVVFQDVDKDGTPDPNEPQNETIDRVYTGFLKLMKEARILAADGTTVLQDYTTDQALLSPQFKPGNLIEYRVTYMNIAPEVPAGSGSVTLTASEVVIVEDGKTGGNTWALDNDANGVIDTANVPGSAADSRSGVITTDPVGDGADVTKYTDAAPDLPPSQSGTFTIRRKLN